jgi:hypothetical protein
MGGAYMYINTANDGSWISWQQTVAAGTFTMNVLYVKGGSGGKFQMSVDGVDVGALTDAYAGVASYNNVLSIADIALTEGVHTIRMTANGKNASAANYQLVPQWFSLERTGA